MVHGKCWRWFNENSTRADADQKCKWHNGATLVSIRNYEVRKLTWNLTCFFKENQALADFIKEKNIDSLWIGLYCTEWTNIDSCIWDIQAGSAANYSSFGEGNNIGDENEKAPEVSARHSSYNCAPPKCALKMSLFLWVSQFRTQFSSVSVERGCKNCVVEIRDFRLSERWYRKVCVLYRERKQHG